MIVKLVNETNEDTNKWLNEFQENSNKNQNDERR
jgi:hypothetical protein